MLKKYFLIGIERMQLKTFRLLKENLSLSILRKYYILIILILFSSIAELVSIGALLPFVHVISSPANLNDYVFLTKIFAVFNLELSYINTVKYLTAVFIAIVLFTTLIKILLLKFMTKVSFDTGAELSTSIFGNTLFQEMPWYHSKNSNDIISNVSLKSNSLVYGLIFPAVSILQASWNITIILGALLYYNPIVTSVIFATVLLAYVLSYLVAKAGFEANAVLISNSQTAILKILRNSFNSIRYILLNDLQEYFIEQFRKNEFSQRSAQGSNNFFSGLPRAVIEGFALISLCIIMLVYLDENGIDSDILATVAIIAFATQKLIPSGQLLFYSFGAIQGNGAAVKESLEYLKLKRVSLDAEEDITFKCRLDLRNVSFRYDTGPKIIDDFSTVIRKGEFIGIVGKTGSGKSTLIDLISGLVEPDEGYISVDNIVLTKNNIKKWRLNVNLLSQNYFFTDGTILANVAFGEVIDNVDRDKVIWALKVAQLYDFVVANGGLLYEVGEEASRLSGGQRQRLALARALYREWEILIVDEGTSALDSITERELFKSLKEVQSRYRKTIIFVTHNLANEIYFDRILNLSEI